MIHTKTRMVIGGGEHIKERRHQCLYIVSYTFLTMQWYCMYVARKKVFCIVTFYDTKKVKFTGHHITQLRITKVKCVAWMYFFSRFRLL